MAHTHQHSPQEMAEIMGRLANRSLRHHWKMFLFEGGVMALIGLGAMIAPNIATLATDIMIGWLLMLVGLVGIGHRLTTRGAPGFWAGLFFSVLTLALGAMLTLWPLQGVLTLTIALVAYFVMHAAYMLLLSGSIDDGWGHITGLLLSAFVDVLLVALILAGWPSTATWILGLFVGISLFFSGLGTIIAALIARRQQPAN